MHANSTSSSIHPRQYSAMDGSSALSLLHLLHLVTQSPVMRSKAAYELPDQPDRAGMRDRREQGQQKLSELQRIRGVEPPENPHTELLEAYGYRQFAQLMMDIPMLAISSIYAMSSSMSFRIGPPGADAAPVEGAKAPAGAKNSFAAFEAKHTKDFEIWVSPAAKGEACMEGMIIVIGENHYDPAIKAILKKVMLGFRRTRGDRFFLEGGADLTCREREEKYMMESGDCRLLEKDCAAFWRLKEFADLTNRKLLECIAYLRKYVASAQEPLNAQNGFAYDQFMKRHSAGLPSLALPGYDALKSAAYKADVQAGKEAARLRPERDAHMVKGVLEQLTETGVNYFIVGSDHLKDVRKLLESRRCIFMVPKLIVKEEPSASLFVGFKDEF